MAVALGSNLGDRARHLATARDALAALPATRLVRASTVEETEPLGGLDQPAYLNQVALLETELDPRALLEACQAIERAAGRVRGERWASRVARSGHHSIRPAHRGRAWTDHPASGAPQP